MRKMKKILLISTNQAVTPYPVPPLGLACLYQRLKFNYDVKIIDGLDQSTDTIINCLNSYKPDYVGISIRNIDDMVKGETYSFLPTILELFITPVRHHYKGVVILGGSGFTIFPYELMELSGADYGIVGEAEDSLVRLLDCLDNEKDPSGLTGVIVRGDKRPLGKTKEHLLLDRTFHAELDKLLDYSSYADRGAYPIQTKRGCVHRCIYCSYPVLEGRRYRRRNVAHVVDEIEATAKRMDSQIIFEFVDSTFNDPPGHAEAICAGIIDRGLAVNLRTMGINPANVTDELLVLMKQAGFAQIDSTPDSGSPTVLERLGKNFSLKQLRQSARLIEKHQMPTMWFFIFGGPGETQETIAETFHFIDQYVNVDDMVHITEGLRIYPNTPLYKLALEERLVRRDESLITPRFYVSPDLGESNLEKIITSEMSGRPNCIRISETKPPPELMAAAIRERKEKDLKEPMFRTLLRLKRELSY